MAEKYALTKGACDALARLLRAEMAVGSRQSGGPGAISPDAYPLPFAVRWSASADSGSGAWVIWLPNLAQLVHYGASAISTISGVTAAAELPSGWYTVDALQASSVALYLVVSVVDATGVVTAALSDQAGTASTGQTVYNLLVASMATNATTGMKSVKQYLASTVTLGGAGGGGGTTGYTGSLTRMTDIEWDTTYHKLVKHYAVETYANGLLIAVAAGQDDDINTTPISAIINNS